MKNHIRMPAALLSLFLSSASFTQQLSMYEIESMSALDLGTLGGEQASARDVNDAGEVVGWAYLADGRRHAFLYRNGAMQDLTPSFGHSMLSHATGINNNTEIVGNYSEPVGNDYVSKPFYWSQYEVMPKTLSMIGNTWAYAINDTGLIVGGARGDWLDYCGFKAYAVQWQNADAPIERLYCPDDNSMFPASATDVNNQGGIVGYHNEQGQFAWRTWTDWGGNPYNVPPLAESTCESWARGTNESGAVAGTVETCAAPNTPRAFFWEGVPGFSKDLGTLPGGSRSEAREVNNQKFVVGYSNAAVNAHGGMQFNIRDRAFIWHPSFGMKALPLPPGAVASTTNCSAYSVSNRDSTGLMRAVGYCVVNGDSRAIRWDVVAKKRPISLPDF